MLNKQDQRTMKTALKMIFFWPFRRFRIEGQKFGPFLVTKYIRNQSYQNMVIIKVGLLFFIFFNEKKIRKIPPIFDIEK